MSRAIVFLLVFWTPLSYAQNQSDAKSKQRTSISFEDELVEGEVQKPVFYIFYKKINLTLKD